MTDNISTPAERRRALRDLIAQAATEDRFDMRQWATGPNYRVARTPAVAAEFHHAHGCGTVACAAGWAVTLMNNNELTELDEYSERVQAGLVAMWLGIPTTAFYTPDWHEIPGPLADALQQADEQDRDLTPEEQAAAFCNYLDTLNTKDNQS